MPPAEEPAISLKPANDDMQLSDKGSDNLQVDRENGAPTFSRSKIAALAYASASPGHGPDSVVPQNQVMIPHYKVLFSILHSDKYIGGAQFSIVT